MIAAVLAMIVTIARRNSYMAAHNAAPPEVFHTVNNGYWGELCEQCKRCGNLQIVSPHMNGNHGYGCNTYPLHNGDDVCPKFERVDDEEMRYRGLRK